MQMLSNLHSHTFCRSLLEKQNQYEEGGIPNSYSSSPSANVVIVVVGRLSLAQDCQ